MSPEIQGFSIKSHFNFEPDWVFIELNFMNGVWYFLRLTSVIQTNVALTGVKLWKPMKMQVITFAKSNSLNMECIFDLQKWKSLKIWISPNMSLTVQYTCLFNYYSPCSPLFLEIDNLSCGQGDFFSPLFEGRIWRVKWGVNRGNVWGSLGHLLASIYLI